MPSRSAGCCWRWCLGCGREQQPARNGQVIRAHGHTGSPQLAGRAGQKELLAEVGAEVWPPGEASS